MATETNKIKLLALLDEMEKGWVKTAGKVFHNPHFLVAQKISPLREAVKATKGDTVDATLADKVLALKADENTQVLKDPALPKEATAAKK